MKSARSFMAVVCTILMVLILGACSNSSSNEKTSIKLAEVTRSIFYAPLYVALENGYFEEEGLEVDLTTTWGGDKTMTSLVSDSSDIALVGSETSIYVHSQGANDPVINFAQLTQKDGTFLVSKKAHDNFSWNDLKESNFLGQRKGGMPQMVGEYVLKQNGIDPHQDLNLSQNIDFGNIPSAFQTGDYEYVQLFEPTASKFEKQGVGHVLASFGEASGKVPYTVFMAKQSFLEDNSETAEKFTRAIYKAQQWVESHKGKEVAEIIQPYFEDIELDIIDESVERYKNSEAYALDPVLDEEEWNNLKDIMDEAGELPEDVKHETLVNTEIAENIINE
ncbi:NitT/TauT family transport system substrate-binding protein [Salinibacillus kushneri]|uniref:NitT/TauT family transport system substrate-binding protein n=1 Tax=Salinibacillus kushneri TaxID=237682 RepID=A0A1H9Y450_9BACI|nr:ABC transporter substrate-binding protein [Salinibacillus kushneri]SES63601.1 NitT/TauT family transport system substrate-binding protein [Salinibacillus kushneri]